MANTYRVVGIDPGNNLGLSCLEVDYDTKEVKALQARTDDLSKYIEKYYQDVVDHHGKAVAKILVIEKVLGGYAEFWCPDFIVHETAFARVGGIDAFASLRECILSIKLAAYRYKRLVQVKAINPNTVKYCVVGEKSSDKSQVISGLKRLKNLDLSEIKLEDLDEHGVDAIAIAYTFIDRHIFGVPKLESPKRSKHVKRRKTRSN